MEEFCEETGLCEITKNRFPVTEILIIGQEIQLQEILKANCTEKLFFFSLKAMFILAAWLIRRSLQMKNQVIQTKNTFIRCLHNRPGRKEQ